MYDDDDEKFSKFEEMDLLGVSFVGVICFIHSFIHSHPRKLWTRGKSS